MDRHPLYLDDLADFLRTEFTTYRYPASEQGGIYKPTNRSIERLGLALEPPPSVSDWVRDQQLDALWLHRPWQLDPATLPPDVGVLFHHLPFDEHLTTGYNPRLASVLGLQSLEELGYKQAVDAPDLPKRPIGMIGNVPKRIHDEWLALIEQVFGGYDQVGPRSVGPRSVGPRSVGPRSVGPCPVGQRIYDRVAVVGAMNPALVQEAHERGVDLYLTGEYRKGTQAAVDKTGLSVIALGHRCTEEWGLRALAHVLREKWPRLVVTPYLEDTA